MDTTPLKERSKNAIEWKNDEDLLFHDIQGTHLDIWPRLFKKNIWLNFMFEEKSAQEVGGILRFLITIRIVIVIESVKKETSSPKSD